MCDRCLSPCQALDKPGCFPPSAPALFGGHRPGPGSADASGWSLALRSGLSILFVKAPRPSSCRLCFMGVETWMWGLQVPFQAGAQGELTLACEALSQPHQDHSMCPAPSLHNLPWLSSPTGAFRWFINYILSTALC